MGDRPAELYHHDQGVRDALIAEVLEASFSSRNPALDLGHAIIPNSCHFQAGSVPKEKCSARNEMVIEPRSLPGLAKDLETSQL